MRLVDCFTDIILFSRHTVEAMADTDVLFDDMRPKIESLLMEAETTAQQNSFESSVIDAAKFAVVGYIDELVLCSTWEDKSKWQTNPLQRKYYSTTNMGAEFYNKLNTLNKHGPDQEAREVFALCLGLGFKGKYFLNDHRRALEEVKDFNLSLLLPGEAQRNIDTATLFPEAYGRHTREGKGSFKPRTNIVPIVLGLPIVFIVVAIIVYNTLIVSSLNDIVKLVG